MADVTVHHVVVSLVEGLHAVDYLEIAVVFVAEYLEIMQLVLENISLKAVKAAALALANDVLQEVAPCNVDVQSGLYFAADGRSGEHIVYHIVIVNAENCESGGTVCVVNALSVNAGDVCALLLVELDYRLEINVRNNIAVGHDNILRAGFMNEFRSACESLKPASVNAVVASAVGREDMQTAGLSCEIPLTAHSEVIHQGVVLSLSDYAHLSDSRIYHAGKREINKAVSGAEGNARHSSCLGQLGKVLFMHISKNKS